MAKQNTANKASGQDMGVELELDETKLDSAEESSTELEASSTESLLGTTQWLVTVYGNMVNLHTSEVFTSEPKRAKVDSFLLAQLEAGKMQIFTE